MGESAKILSDAEILERSPLQAIEAKIKELLDGVVIEDLSSAQRIDLAAKLTNQYVRVFTLMQDVQQRVQERKQNAAMEGVRQLMLGWNEDESEEDEESAGTLFFHDEPS